MTSPLLFAPAPAASPYERWHRRFLENHDRPSRLPWHDAGLLSAAELQLVGRSMQQFQLGEWSRGRGLIGRAAAQPVLAADPWFLPALELFIAEEQGHSAILGRFLDRERIPRLERHWLDAVFRRLRQVAGLEACAMVLVTAEVLALPFYQALRDATHSRLLHSICVRILCDEAAHLNYQALALGLMRRPLRDGARKLRSLCHSALFHGTALLLWQQHWRVFHAAGWSFRRFWNDSRRGFARLQFQIRQVSLDGGRADSFDELRLD
jgi:hypothetical protein